MTVYACNQPVSRWDDPTHFTPNGTPGNGDQITLDNQTLVISGTRVIGTSAPAANNEFSIHAMTTGGPCHLQFEEDAHLTYRGEIRLDGHFTQWNSIKMAPGVTIIHDSSAAADPTNQHYPITMGTINQARCFWDYTACNNPAKWCRIESTVGGGRGWSTGSASWAKTGGMYCPDGTGYVHHKRWGGRSSDNYAYTTGNTSDLNYMYRNMTFDDCGGIRILSGFSGSSQPVWQNINFQNTKTQYAFLCESAADLAVKPVTENMAADKLCRWAQSEWHIIRNCVFGGGWPVIFREVETWENNVVIANSSSAWAPPLENPTNMIMISDHSSGAPKFFETKDSATVNINGLVCIYTGPFVTEPGEAILLGSNNSVCVATRVIVLDNKAHDSTIALASLRGGTGSQMTLSNSTCRSHGVITGRTYAGHTGQFPSLKDCLFDNASANNVYKLQDETGTTLNPILPANATNNGGNNLQVGSNQKGYHNMNLNPNDGTIGANDVDADPQFKAELYLEDWDTANGGPGTTANAIQQMLLWNAEGGNTAYNPANLLDAMFGDNDNWAPTNAAYNGTSSTGGTIGAKGWKEPDVPPPTGQAGAVWYGRGVFQ